MSPCIPQTATIPDPFSPEQYSPRGGAATRQGFQWGVAEQGGPQEPESGEGLACTGATSLPGFMPSICTSNTLFSLAGPGFPHL